MNQLKQRTAYKNAHSEPLGELTKRKPLKGGFGKGHKLAADKLSSRCRSGKHRECFSLNCECKCGHPA